MEDAHRADLDRVLMAALLGHLGSMHCHRTNGDHIWEWVIGEEIVSDLVDELVCGGELIHDGEDWFRG